MTILHWLLQALLPAPRYRVSHQKVILPFFNPQVENHVYGPYRSKLWAIVVAHMICGEWDRVTVEERPCPNA